MCIRDSPQISATLEAVRVRILGIDDVLAEACDPGPTGQSRHHRRAVCRPGLSHEPARELSAELLRCRVSTYADFRPHHRAANSVPRATRVKTYLSDSRLPLGEQGKYSVL